MLDRRQALFAFGAVQGDGWVARLHMQERSQASHVGRPLAVERQSDASDKEH